MSGENASLFRSSRFRWLVGIVIFMGCLLGWRTYQASRIIALRLQVLEGAGLPVTAGDLDRYYSVPDGGVDSTFAWVEAINSARNAFAEHAVDGLPVVGLSEIPVLPPGEDWEQLGEVRAFLKTLQPTMASIRTAAAEHGQVRFPVNYNMGFSATLPHLQGCRRLARLLVLDAHVCAHDGDTTGAKNDVLDILALSEAVRGERCLLGQLVRVALQAIACNVTAELIPYGDWSDSDLMEIQWAVRKVENKGAFSEAFYGEQAIVLSETKRQLPFYARNSSTTKSLEIFEGLQSALDGNWWDAIAVTRQLGRDVIALKQNAIGRLKYIGPITFMPGMFSGVQAGARADVKLLAVDVLVAIKRFQLETGTVPDSLTQLVPKHLRSVPDDPFDGAAIRYRKTETGVVVYSVFEDASDDGGLIDGAGRTDCGLSFSVISSDNNHGGG